MQGNFIGTDVSGTTGLANLSSGVEVGLQVLVGGTTPAARNIISGNEEFGVKVGGFQAMVQGNFIGTDVTGTKALGNFIGGVAVNSGINNVIGGAAQGAGNLISGNRGAGGIDLRGENNLVQGNLIGTDVTGAETLGNMGSGVAVRASGNQIGGTAPGTCNVISANQIGVQIGGGISTGPDRAVVQGNFIGTDISGAVALPNTIHGIVIVDSRDNLIGGDEAGAGNTIAFNENIGIAVFSSTSLRNSIRGNSIFSNGDLGIDMLPSNLIGVIVGVTPNDPCDVDSGQNNLQNFPVLGPASSSGNVTTVQGTLNSKPNTPHTIEFFANDTCDPSGFGEGQTFIGSTTVTTGNDCNGGFI